MTPDQLLERVATVLRKEIGPAVGAEYPRTQAFMASVVLQKLARQLASAETHRAAGVADMDALVADLDVALAAEAPPAGIVAAVSELGRARDDATLCGLIEALYRDRAGLGAARFDALLGRVRRTLRASVDRRMEYAA